MSKSLMLFMIDLLINFNFNTKCVCISSEIKYFFLLLLNTSSKGYTLYSNWNLQKMLTNIRKNKKWINLRQFLKFRKAKLISVSKNLSRFTIMFLVNGPKILSFFRRAYFFIIFFYVFSYKLFLFPICIWISINYFLII